MTFPASPTSGQQATEGGRLFQWNGSNAWELVANVAGHAAQHATGGSDAITAANIGALTQTAADARYVELTGDTMSGGLSINAATPLTAYGGRTMLAPASEPFGLGVRYVSSGGPVYFGATDSTPTPGMQISKAGGGAMMTISNAGAAAIPGTLTVGGSAVLTAAQAHTPANAIDWLPRGFGTFGVVGGTSGMLSLAFFTAPTAMTVTTITFVNGGVASASLTLCKFALFTVSETITNAATVTTPSVTMVAQTANDTTIGNVVHAVYSRTFSTAGGFPASYSLVAGTRYAVGFLLVGTTPGQWQTATVTAGTFMRLPPSVSGAVLSLSDMPTSATSVPFGNYIMYGRIS